MLISGTSTALEALIPNKFLDPLEPVLILPEVKEPKYWRGGAIEFLEDEMGGPVTAKMIAKRIPSLSLADIENAVKFLKERHRTER